MADGVKDSTLLWERLRPLIDVGDTKGVGDLFAGMSERDRRTLVRPVRAYAKEPAAWEPGMDWLTAGDLYNRRQKPTFVAGLAVISGAPAVAKWIAARWSRLGWNGLPIEECVRVLRERNPEWLPALPEEVCAVLDGMGSPVWDLVNVLAEGLGVEVSASPNYVHGWASQFRATPVGDRDAGVALIAEKMRAERRLAEFLPVLFAGGTLDTFVNEWSWVRRAVAVVAADGGPVRDGILDASLRRLLQGGQNGAVREHTTFWAALAPTDAETVVRAASCISLLSSQYGFVAKEFLATLKRASDAGLLDVELALESASIVVTRQEKYLVKAGLGWLEALARKHPDRTGELMTTAVAAFASQGADLQERAVKAVTKRAKALSVEDRARIVDEARLLLPPHLAVEVVAALGTGDQDATAEKAVGDKTVYPEVAPYVPRPMPKPVASPAELAEEYARLMTGEPAEAMELERVLAAFVEFAADRAGLREALAPVVERYAQSWLWMDRTDRLTPRRALQSLAEAVTSPGGRQRSERATFAEIWHPGPNAHSYRERVSPAHLIAARIAELAAAFEVAPGGTRPPRMLLSTPTDVTGIVDPKTLLERLRTAESEGWQPLTLDFHQALLRLPADCGGVDVSGPSSEHGLVFADWCDGERALLPPTRRTPYRTEFSWDRPGDWNTYRAQLPGDTPRHPESFLEMAAYSWQGNTWNPEGSEWWNCWPAVVPSRPDLAVAALVSYLGENRRSTAVATLLAEADDPAQDGLHFLLSRQMADRAAPMRAGAVDAALVLASRGLLDGERLGADLADALREPFCAGLLKILPGLRDMANAGAARQVWAAVAELLARALPPAVPKTLTGTGDLLAFATELADAFEVRGSVASVAALAAKKGGGTVQTAARRLDAVLTGERGNHGHGRRVQTV